jgi:hypothetical protein
MLIRLRRTALSKTPHALADSLMLVFQHPANVSNRFSSSDAGVYGNRLTMSTRLSFDMFQMGLSGRIEQPATAGPFRARAAIPDMVMSAKLFSYEFL